MRSFALVLSAALPLAAVAQSPAPMPSEEWSPPPATEPGGATESESGLGLIERGVGTVFENLLRDLQPQMEDMARGLDQTFNRFAPVFDDISTLMDDIGNYGAPERLPNGDILIRRRPDAPPPPPVGNALRDLTRPSPAVPAPEPDNAPADAAPGAQIEL